MASLTSTNRYFVTAATSSASLSTWSTTSGRGYVKACAHMAKPKPAHICLKKSMSASCTPLRTIYSLKHEKRLLIKEKNYTGNNVQYTIFLGLWFKTLHQRRYGNCRRDVDYIM